MVIKHIFNFLSFLLLFSSLSVISLRNSFLSVMGLVVCFTVSSAILLLLECEFFALLFIIIYVGAIAVLFLFVIMMLDLKHIDNTTLLSQMFVSLVVSCLFSILVFPLIESCFFWDYYSDVNRFVVETFHVNYYSDDPKYLGQLLFMEENLFENFYTEDDLTEIEVLGQLLYTRYALQFLIVGLILSLAVLCVGVLTIKRNTFITEVRGLVVSRTYSGEGFI